LEMHFLRSLPIGYALESFNSNISEGNGVAMTGRYDITNLWVSFGCYSHMNRFA
jgi:hypothetical protein